MIKLLLRHPQSLARDCSGCAGKDGKGRRILASLFSPSLRPLLHFRSHAPLARIRTRSESPLRKREGNLEETENAKCTS